MITIKSKGIRRIPHLEILLNDSVSAKIMPETTHFGVWGIGKESNRLAELEAIKKNIPLIRMEDGLIRGYSINEPTYSLYTSHSGIYYDCTQESNVEALLNSEWKPTPQDREKYKLCLEMIKKYNISKYNDAPDIPKDYFRTDKPNLLLIDQTYNDQSISYGGATSFNFHQMLQNALLESDKFNIYVKIHPEVISGKKRGYVHELLDTLSEELKSRVHIISTNYNVPSCLKYVEEVYVVTSQVGFDALLRDKEVTCFGQPFYSGWGQTEDLKINTNRNKMRSIEDIFIAMMFYCTTYINPFTQKKGELIDVIDYISLQKRHSNEQNISFYKTKLWKRAILEQFLRTNKKRTNFISKLDKSSSIKPLIATWGYKSFAEINSPQKCCVEDGFIRSVGLGSELELPVSLVVDYNGIYFNPQTESDLEKILNFEEFTNYEKKQAKCIIEELFLKKITKYNVGMNNNNLAQIKAKHPNKKIILAPGQVEDDASIFFGTKDINTNLKLLNAIAKNNDNCVIIYKPHPDVLAGNRQGSITDENLQMLKSHHTNTDFYVESQSNILDCFDIADEVHVMTSTSGLEAILRDKTVVTYGLPFYGGYGLTKDMQTYPRPRRKLTKEELILGCYLLYPRYLLPGCANFQNASTAINYIFENKNKQINIKKTFLNQIKRRVKFCVRTIQAIL